MNLPLLKDFSIEVWYKGFKTLSVINITDNSIVFSNNDKIKIIDNNIYLNNNIICNIQLNNDQLIELYKHILIKKGYKFI